MFDMLVLHNNLYQGGSCVRLGVKYRPIFFKFGWIGLMIDIEKVYVKPVYNETR